MQLNFLEESQIQINFCSEHFGAKEEIAIRFTFSQFF